MSLLSLESVSVEIGDTKVCRHLSMGLGDGEVWSILGRNGVGKSTLLKTMAGLRMPQRGAVQLCGTGLQNLSRRERAQRLGILFQDSESLFPATVLETVLTGRHPWTSAMRGESADDVERARQALVRVGLAALAGRDLTSLSGGERRRVDLAALMVQEPRIVLLDEPGNHLDMHYQVAVLGDLVRDWKAAGGAVVAVMHDVNLALRFSDHLMLLYGDGEVACGTIGELASESALSRLYGHRMERVTTATGEWFFPV